MTDALDGIVLSGWFAGRMRMGSYVLQSAGGQEMFVAKLDPQGGCFGQAHGRPRG